MAGLGDRSYPKFNFATKRLHGQLTQLGATPMTAPALGDDQHDHDDNDVTSPYSPSSSSWVSPMSYMTLSR